MLQANVYAWQLIIIHRSKIFVPQTTKCVNWWSACNCQTVTWGRPCLCCRCRKTFFLFQTTFYGPGSATGGPNCSFSCFTTYAFFNISFYPSINYTSWQFASYHKEFFAAWTLSCGIQIFRWTQLIAILLWHFLFCSFSSPTGVKIALQPLYPMTLFGDSLMNSSSCDFGHWVPHVPQGQIPNK